MVIIISDCSRCGRTAHFEHLHFQKHDFALFHLLDPLGESGPRSANPVSGYEHDVLLACFEIIREQYLEAVQEYLVKATRPTLSTPIIDVVTDQPYDQRYRGLFD